MRHFNILIYFYSEPGLSLVEAPILAPGEVTIDQQ